MDESILAELRAIRGEIHDLAERVGQAASRDDLKQYTPLATFDAHLEEARRDAANWRAWTPFAMSAAALAWTILQHVHLS